MLTRDNSGSWVEQALHNNSDRHSIRASSSSASRKCPSLCPLLEALVDDAGAHTKPILVDGLPLAAGPKSTYQMPLITALLHALGLPPRFVLLVFLFLGKHFLSFLQRGQ